MGKLCLLQSDYLSCLYTFTHIAPCLFQVLHKIITGTASQSGQAGLTRPSSSEDFDPTIISDDLLHQQRSTSIERSPSKSQAKSMQCQKAVSLCAETVLAHLVNHLGHFPMAIGAARLSSLVAEHDDVPNLSSDDLSNVIFSVPNIQVSKCVILKIKI